MLEQFTSAINEFSFAVGYTVVVSCVIYGAITTVKALIHKKEQNSVSAE